MTAATSTGLLQRLVQTEPADNAPLEAVPVYGLDMYLGLVHEAAAAALEYGGEDLLLLCDAHTAGQSRLEKLRDRAKHVVVLGEKLDAWDGLANLTLCGEHRAFQEHDHIFLLQSTTLHLALLGSSTTNGADSISNFTGCWTVSAPCTRHVVSQVLHGHVELKRELPEHHRPDLMLTVATRMMARQAEALVTMQRDMALDRNDLFSVLNILKAISAKRRAHDVLFVFVEQIARVVKADRCSIVRVWGREQTAQVLASHEDASIDHHDIELNKYPELLECLRSREKVVISNVRTSDIMKSVAESLESAQIHSLLVIPIMLFDESAGSLFLRAARAKGSFTLREISFFEIVAEAAANALERAQLFESIQVANERLERLAVTDGLTGLYNHRYCRDRMIEEFQRAMRYRLPLSCMIFDVDNFKSFNDTYGHLLGDMILHEIAERTQACIRKSDLVARYGGEEFVVVMPQTDLAGAVAEGERLRSAIASRGFTGVPQGAQVTVSVGVSSLDHARMRDADDLMRSADEALYRAKRTGKNKVCFNEPE